MKLKALAQLAKGTKEVTLLNSLDRSGEIARQHVVVHGNKIYPLDNLPTVDANTLLAVLDVTRDEQPNWEVRQSEATELTRHMMEDAAGSDIPATPSKVRISFGGVELVPMYTQKGMVFIRAAALKPLADMRGIEYALREYWGHRVIIALNGMLNVAAIGLWKDITDDEADELMHIANAARALANGRQSEGAGDE